jgi:hypothetical protein
MVQVIPKELEQPEGLEKKIFPWLSLILVIIVIFAYFFILRQDSKAKTELETVETDIKRQQDASFKTLEQEVLAQKRKIDDVFRLIEARKQASQTFVFLEQYVHPQIYFSGITLNMGTGNLELEGTAKNFISLGEQIHILKDSGFSQNIGLKSIGLDQSDGIKFKLEVLLFAIKQDTTAR